MMMRLLLPQSNQSKHVILDTVLRGLYNRYLERVPQVTTIVDHLVSKLSSQPQAAPSLSTTVTSNDDTTGDVNMMKMMTIENDHIAVRSLFIPNDDDDDDDAIMIQDNDTTTPPFLMGIAGLEYYFLKHCGYTKRDNYQFVEKKLNAHWYAPPDPTYPRIFISELKVPELSEPAQSILRKCRHRHRVPEQQKEERQSLWAYLLSQQQPGNENESLYSYQQQIAIGNAIVQELQAPLFDPQDVTYAHYEQLQRESEYAAWVYGMNSHDMNHWTLAVHTLPPPYNDLNVINNMVSNQLHMALNQPDGPIQTSPDGLLRQSSTRAALMPVTFADRLPQMMIPGSYVEFAERQVLPEFRHVSPSHRTRQHYRDGFETSNAAVIFDSTTLS
jgi:Domain of unknown function (DUF1338)